MIDEVNLKLNLTGNLKITNFMSLWRNITETYSAILFHEMTPNVEMSQFFIDHIDDVSYLVYFVACTFLIFCNFFYRQTG